MIGSALVRAPYASRATRAGWKPGISAKSPTVMTPSRRGQTHAEMMGTDPTKHVREFLDSIRSRKPTACNSSVVRHTEVACHAAAISWKLGRRLKFDPAKEQFIGDAEANALCSYQRRAPFTV